MAFQRRRRIFSRRRRSLKRWTAQLQNVATAGVTDNDFLFTGGPHAVVTLLNQTTYAQNASLESKGATCLRIVGTVFWFPGVSENMNAPVLLTAQSIGVIMPHEPGNVPNPADVAELIKEDVMHTWSDLQLYDIADEGAGTFQNHFLFFQPYGYTQRVIRHDFDIRVRRRLDNQNISLIMAFGTTGAQGGGGTFNFEVGVVARVLLAGNF